MYVVYILYIILSVYINVAVVFDDFSNKIFLVKKTTFPVEFNSPGICDGPSSIQYLY